MAKRLRTQRRGAGGNQYRSPSHRHVDDIRLPAVSNAEGIVKDIIHAPGRTSPLAVVDYDGKKNYQIAAEGMSVGQKVVIVGECHITADGEAVSPVGGFLSHTFGESHGHELSRLFRGDSAIVGVHAHQPAVTFRHCDDALPTPGTSAASGLAEHLHSQSEVGSASVAKRVFLFKQRGYIGGKCASPVIFCGYEHACKAWVTRHFPTPPSLSSDTSGIVEGTEHP